MSSLLTNLALSIHGKKGVEMTNPMEFMLDWSGGKKEQKKQTVEEMKNFLMQFAKTQNKRVSKRKTPPVKKGK